MKSPLVVLALAALASAAVDINYAALLPAALERRAAELVPRQTSSSSGTTPSLPSIPSGCLSAASDALANIPTPPPDVASALVQQRGSDFCSFSTPSSLTSDFSKFSSEIVSWASANKDKLSACSQLTSLSPISACDKKSQSSATAAASATSSRPPNSGARETGMAMAAVAAACFAVAAL